jgi:hypothetical protein
LLVTLFVNGTTAPAIAHTHTDWDIRGDHHFGGHVHANRHQATDNQSSARESTTDRSETGPVCDHGHRHHGGGLHTRSMRAERSSSAKRDADRNSLSLSAASLSAASIVRHWHVSWLAVEFTIPAPPEQSDDCDRDQDSAPSVVRLYDHTSSVVRADVGGKFDLASCSASLFSGYFVDSAFGAIGSRSSSPPLLCGIASPQRSSVLRI